MKQRDIAVLFTQIADLLEFRGDNPFRIRAYRRAAQSLERLSGDVERLAAEDRLREIPGIGEDLANKIREYLAGGSIEALEKLKRGTARGAVEFMEIPGVGPKTAKLISDRLRITSIAQLAAAARAHRLRALPGFKAQKEQNILKGIELVRQGRERMPLGVAWRTAQELLGWLRKAPGVRRAEPAGSLRRMRETIGDLDLLVASTQPLRVMKALTGSPWCARVLASGETKSSILTPEGLQVDVRVVEPDSFGTALQYFTGSKEHNVRLREMAARKGLKINEYGVFRLKTGRRIAGREEAGVYEAMGLSWIPPEIREDSGEFDAALAGRLPALVELADIRGDFHVHTNRTDGRHPLAEVVEAARRRGYQYVAITDHSKSLTVAHGLSEAEARKQAREIGQLNQRLGRGFRVLAGGEVDILASGAMDYSDGLLGELEFVLGSVHSSFKQDEAVMTARIIRAIRHSGVSMIAHPTGRLLGQREAYAVDLEAVYRAACETGTALEINASPQRLDLESAAARRAAACGVRLGLSTDMHSLDQLDDMAIGVGLARRAWLEPKHLLNCLSLEELLKWTQQKRKRIAA